MNDKKMTVSYSDKNFETYKKKARNISTEIYKMNIRLYQSEEIVESASFRKHLTSNKEKILEKYQEFNLSFD